MSLTPIYRTLSLDPRVNTFQQLVRELADGEIDLDPPYQRGHVWGEPRQTALIRSLTMGLPTGAIFLNERDEVAPRVCVDGKQRLSAVKKWLDGELAVPAWWFAPEQLDRHASEVTFKDLTLPTQRGWRLGATTTVYLTKYTGPDAEARERELFSLINEGGVKQGESDLD